MIRYSNEDGFIKCHGMKFRKGQNPNILLPKVAVGVFSKHLFFDTIKEYNCKPVGYMSCANFERDVYILKYKGQEITFFMAGVGAPLLSGDIEELAYHGVNKIIIFGNCGVLDNRIPDCSIIIPTKGFREEGTSYHYIEQSDTINMNPKYQENFIKILKNYNFTYTKGSTWTTDAFYRETKEKINYFKKQGAICVEMEGTAIAAVCQRLKIEYFTFYYAGDNLDSEEWDERSLHGLSNFEKKQKVRLLALDLAYTISKEQKLNK